MNQSIKPELKKAIAEYYKWHESRCIHPVRFVSNRSGFEMVLVRFKDSEKTEMSSLMLFDEWADGHYTVDELYYSPRENEDELIAEYEADEGVDIIGEMKNRSECEVPTGPRDCSMCAWYDSRNKYCSMYHETHYPSDGENCPGWRHWETI